MAEDEKTQSMIEELYRALLLPKNTQELSALLCDLCTYTELRQMAQRVRAAELLMQGKTYSRIIAETDISSATLSRVSRCVTHGSGGYERIIGQLIGEDGQ